MKILGISAYYHDSAAVITDDGKIIAAAQEERFTRKKQDASFPVNSVKFCLEYSGFSIKELDAVVFYDKPLLKFERLLETYMEHAPKGINTFLKAIPVWIKEKVFLKDLIVKELKNIELVKSKDVKLLFPEHHLSHAASAFFPSRFQEAAILTLDGVGEWATTSICYGDKNNITVLKEIHFPHSIGLLYSAFTYFLGFKVNSGEYKLMGLAPYGIPNSERVNKFCEIIKSKLVTIKPDGSFALNMKYFNYETGLTMIKEKLWTELFGFGLKKEKDELKQHHCDLAMAIQIVTEEIIILLAKECKRLTNSKNICLAGGVALNCVANGKLLRSELFENIFIQPAAGDAGGALGAALAANYIYFSAERRLSENTDEMCGAYLGPEFSDLDIELAVKKHKAAFTKFNEFEKLASSACDLLSEGKVVGWFQGRMEFGPRALGNRSILGDSRSPEMQKKLNLKIKFREGFRPFAPSVLSEEKEKYFDTKTDSPYMLYTADVVKERRNILPENYFDLALSERLYILRSDMPAITHIDFSARLQTVHKDTNFRYWKLIDTFREKTGYGVIVNTSFNVRGEPIVCSPDEAYRCFMRTEMDYLVMGNYLFSKTEQPDFDNVEKWRQEFDKD
jgi:carbamoyltransferase